MSRMKTMPEYEGHAPDTGEIMNQARHDTLVEAIRAIVTDAFEGDYQGGVEFLATVLVEHADLEDYPAQALDAVKDALARTGVKS